MFRSSPEDLGTQYILMSGHIQQANGLTNLLFGLSIAINFCSVKEVDAIVPGGLDAINSVLFGFLGVGVEPVAKGDDGDLDAGGAEEAVLHCHDV